MSYKAINWNKIEDVIDKATWEKLTEQFWLDTRIPISNDIDDWRKLSQQEKDLVAKVFGGLTLLDTLQSEVGVESLVPHARTQHEISVYRDVSLMEAVHAKSYSSIFSTLLTPKEIDDVFEWTHTHPALQKKAQIVEDIYKNGTSLERKIASVFLESFLFYSGFFTPLYYLGNNKLPNVAEVIKLIIRDECLTKDHFLLTPTGWKSVSEIRIGDLVVQFDKDTKELSFAKVQQTSTHVPEKTYVLKTEQNQLSVHCSPNHRILGYYNSNPIVQTAKEFEKDNKHIPNTGDFVSIDCEPLTAQERFLIALHANGSYDNTLNKSGQISVRFSLSEQRKVEEFEALLSELNYTYSKVADTVQIPNQATWYHYTVQMPVDLATDDRVKVLPTRDFNTVDKQWCRDYIDEIAKWDGHIVKENPDCITYDTVDSEAAKMAQTIATLAGYRTHYRILEDHRKESYQDIYRVQININNQTTDTQCLTVEEAPAQQVYGVQVPAGFLLTKHNNAVSVTGNSVHGTYIGYKAQLEYNELPESEQSQIRDWAYDLLMTLYENELEYTHDLYDEIGWTDDVITFLEYNANKALMNLGFDPLFSTSEQDVNPIIMNGISTGTSNHDFFSQVGNGYLLGQVEAMQDDDYNFGK